MRKTAAKGILFSILGLASVPAFAEIANDKSELILIEELPLDVRGLVQQQVIGFLRQNPQLIDEASSIALDSKGTIYVLDKNMAAVGSVGSPSCVSRGTSFKGSED